MKRAAFYWRSHTELLMAGVTAFTLLAGVLQYTLGWTYVLTVTPIVISSITALVVLFWHAPPKRKAILFLTAFVVGVVIELIGIHTALLFGNYTYGSVLGVKIAAVPLLVGILWVLVTIAAWQIVSFSIFGKWANVFLAACVAVMFDLILEQFATAFGLWSWQDGIIPLKNYLTWFVVSFLLCAAYGTYAKQVKPSIYGACVLPMLSVFFWLMLVVR